MKDYGLSQDAMRRTLAPAFRRRQAKDPLKWMPWHVRFPSTWEASAFDFDKAPHVRGVITRGVLDPTIKKINLCWATRLCKTSTLLSVGEWVGCEAPSPMVFQFPDALMMEDALAEHVYPMLKENSLIRRQLPPEHKQNRKAIQLRECRIRLASAGSKSSNSGYPARWVFKFEVNKFSTRKSSEADAYYTIESRCSGYPRGAKILEEGTPADLGSCRANKLLSDPNVRQYQYHVPCPHCREFQILDFSRVVIPRGEDGEHNPMLAQRGAYYSCEHCEQQIGDHHRVAMMQAGRWLAAGEYLDAAGNQCGTPEVDSDTVIFGPLSKLYSLFIAGWGTVAKEFVEAKAELRKGNLEAMKKFQTETLAKTWKPSPVVVPANELALHVRGTHNRTELPADTAFIVTGVDVGLVGESLLFHWQVQAWCRGAQGAVVDWGMAGSVDEFVKWIGSTYPVQGSTAFLPVAEFPIGIDSSRYTSEVYAVCDMIEQAVPIKGDSRTGNNVSVDLYYWGYRRTDQSSRMVNLRKQMGAGDLLMMNSELTQQYRTAWTEKRLQPGYAGFISLPADVCDDWEQHQSLFSQFTADYKDGGKWKRDGSNEAGDCLRIGRVLAEYYTVNGNNWDSVVFPTRFNGQPQSTARVAVGRADRPRQSGNPYHQSPFLVSQR